MKTNQTPYYDASDNTTHCCPRFSPKGWDDQELRFSDKRFVRAVTLSFFHIPLNMGAVYTRTMRAIAAAKALDEEHTLVLTREISPWKAEHLWAVDKDVPGQEMVKLSGEYLTKVFEGPYAMAQGWMEKLKIAVENTGKVMGQAYFFYTTCPKCAKAYGKNYAVGVGEIK